MLLAIDTSTRQMSLALHDGLSVVAETSWRTGDYHSVELAPQTAVMLRRAGVEPARLAGVAVAIGPGSYTALRIGLALAKGLALTPTPSQSNHKHAANLLSIAAKSRTSRLQRKRWDSAEGLDFASEARRVPFRY